MPMQYLIYLLFFIVFIGEYIFPKIGIQHRALAILPEVISIICGVYVLLCIAFNKSMKVQWRYALLYIALLFHIAIGLIGNLVHPLAIISGMRMYLKFLPFYFLPMVYEISKEDIAKQFKFLLGIVILQLPLAVYQRFFEYGRLVTGDYIAGTLGTAPMLTIFLTAAISMFVASYLKDRIGIKELIILLIVAFVPIALNETKASVILLPVAILIPTIFGVKNKEKIRILATTIPLTIILVIGFNSIYKIVYTKRADMLDFYTSDKIANYMYKSPDPNKIEGKEGETGRIDAIILAYRSNADDYFRLFWGVGIGNAAVSFSKKFEGNYTEEYKRLGGKMTSVSHFIWEIGLLGIVLIICFLMLIFNDAMKLKDKKDIVGTIALSWLGVTCITLLIIAYQNIIAKDALVYTFVYYSGYLSAMAYKIQNRLSVGENYYKASD